MFVVAGLTGNTGSHVADALLARGERVRGVVRDLGSAEPWAARGVELARADMNDSTALARALEGAAGAYLLVPPRLDHPAPRDHYAAIARSVGEAVREAGLRRLVFLSSIAAHLPSGTGPIEGLHRAEEILAGSAPHVTFLRPSFFQENWKTVLGPVRQQGVLPTFFADLDAKNPMVAGADIGRVAADLLLDPDPPPVCELGGPEPYSVNDVAAAMASAFGRPVVPVQPPRAAWVGALTEAGVGPAYAELIAQMYDGLNGNHVRFSGTVPVRAGKVGLAETLRGWADAA